MGIKKLKNSRFKIIVEDANNTWEEEYNVQDLANSTNREIKDYFKNMVDEFNRKEIITDNKRRLVKILREYYIKTKTSKDFKFYIVK